MRRTFSLLFLIAFSIVITGSSSAFAKGEDAEYIESVRAAIDEVCMSMTPYVEKADKVKSINLVNEPEINAYADTKGGVTFFMGMVDFVRTEDEIAAVCGHEMGHLSAQHIKRSIGNSVLATIAQVAIGGTAGNVAGALIQSKQSRKHEREADQKGLMYMWQAGYDPRSIWKFWQSLKNHYDMGNIKIQSYFSTHPVNDERIMNFKVLPVRVCKENPAMPYCDDILNDVELVNAFNRFEARD